MPNTVQVRYGCTDEGGDIQTPNVLTLGLPADLEARLKDWCDEYQATYDDSYPGDSGFKDQEVRRGFLTRGRELAQQLADTLGSPVPVMYKGAGAYTAERLTPTTS